MYRLLLLLLTWLALSVQAALFDPLPVPGNGLGGQPGFLPVHQAFRPELLDSQTERLQFRVRIAKGYYLYRQRFQLHTDTPQVTLGPPAFPAGLQKQDDYFGAVEIYPDDLEFSVPVHNPRQRAFSLQLTWQGCAEQGLCYPPETTRFAITPPAAPASSAPAPAPVTAVQTETEPLSWQALSVFFLAGLGLAFTPCVLPMLPILSGIVLQGEQRGGRSLALAGAYVLSMASIFALLGAAMGLFGAELNLQARLQSPWILGPFALFFVAFALAMFGTFELRLPGKLAAPLERLASRTRGGSLGGAALLGALSSLLVSPCVSAPLAGALLYISRSGDAWGGGLRLLALGLGMGTPMLLLAAGGQALLPKSGPWLLAVRNLFGILLLGVAIWLMERLLPAPLTLALWGLLAGGTALFLGTLEFIPKPASRKLAQLLGLGLLTYAIAAWTGALQGHGNPLDPLEALGAVPAPENRAPAAGRPQWQTIDSVAGLEALQARAQHEKRLLILDWYADWCISCKIMEKEIFANPGLLGWLQPHQLVRFDMTANTPEQRALLDRLGLFGPPAIQFMAPDGRELKQSRLVGEVDAGTFVRHLQKLAQ